MCLHGEDLLRPKRVELELFKFNTSLHILSLDLPRQLLLCPIWIELRRVHCFAEVASGTCFALFHIAVPSTQKQMIWGWVFTSKGHLIILWNCCSTSSLSCKAFLRPVCFWASKCTTCDKWTRLCRGNSCFVYYTILYLLCAHNFTTI